MAFTEFCCRSGGSNLNAGTRTGNSTEPGTSADFTYAGGSWVNSTRVFTVASGNPSTDGVAVGDFAALDTGGSTAAFIGRVTAVSSTTITLSGTANSGTNPANGTYTLRIGGAFQGPSGSAAFPLGFVTTSLTNVAGNIPRINLKNAASYSLTAGITSNAAGPIVIQGYSSTYGDGGKATIAGPSTGSAVTPLTITPSTSQWVIDICVTGTGATGVGDCVSVNGQYAYLRGVVAYGARGRGFVLSSSNIVVEECEAYGNNTSNTSGYGGFSSSAGSNHTYIRCVSHDNIGNNSFGFNADAGVQYLNCIADTNGGVGFVAGSSMSQVYTNCDAYNNGSHGFNVVSRWATLESCNSVKNGGFGFLLTSTTYAFLSHCGIGSGSQANTSGGYSLNASTDAVTSGVTYASGVTPWVDPANGDFRINLVAAKGAGRGVFTQTAASYSGTTGYPDIGAAQHQDSSGSGGGSLINSQQLVRQGWM